MAIIIDGKVVSSKTKKVVKKDKKIISNIGKEVWWINNSLDLLVGTIIKEVENNYLVKALNRSYKNNPTREIKEVLVDKNKINF